MGTVYAGVNKETGQEAAVKVLSSMLATEADFRDRFESEIESLRKLRHPNIVRLFGFGEQDGHLFYAMELVDGVSLDEAIRGERRFDWREVAEIGIQICRALKHAHDHGVIHRDIKPANVLLDREGKVKLTDFGIAKLFGSAGVTGDGGVIGTAEYMAPEQADGRPVTYRCDLYSLGGVLYALLAGRPPFQGSTLPEVLQLQRFAEPEPLRRYAPNVPRELELFVHDLLKKEPQDRISNAMLACRRLEAMVHGLAAQQTSLDAGATGRPEETASAPPEVTQVDQSQVDPSDVTRAVSADDVKPRKTVSDDFVVDHFAQTQAGTGHEIDQGTGEPALTPPSSPPRPQFTKVEDDEHAIKTGGATPRDRYFWLQTALLAAALLILVGGAWYVFKPAGADELYSRIAVAAEDDDFDELVKMEGDIHSYLDRFGDDDRAEELRGYLEEIELYRRGRQLERRSRRIERSASPSPVEQAYLEALRYARLDPDRGIAKLQALIALYEIESDESPKTRQCLELARRQLDELRTQTESIASQHEPLLRAKLAEAAGLASDEPARARQIWQAIIELYDDKPWAKESVEEARRALLTSEEPARAASTADGPTAH